MVERYKHLHQKQLKAFKMKSDEVRRISEGVAAAVQIPPSGTREAGQRIPQLLAELADHSVLVEALLRRASEISDPLVKAVLEGTAIELTDHASDLLTKMEVARAVAGRQQESDNAHRQEVWSGIPLQDELLLEFAVKLPSSIQRPFVEQWFKNVGS